MGYLPLVTYPHKEGNVPLGLYATWFSILFLLLMLFLTCFLYDFGFVTEGVVLSTSSIKVVLPSSQETEVQKYRYIEVEGVKLEIKEINLGSVAILEKQLWTEVTFVFLPQEHFIPGRYKKIKMITSRTTLLDRTVYYLKGGNYETVK